MPRAAWTRIWWVRPVSGVNTITRARRARATPPVRHRLPAGGVRRPSASPPRRWRSCRAPGRPSRSPPRRRRRAPRHRSCRPLASRTRAGRPCAPWDCGRAAGSRDVSRSSRWTGSGRRWNPKRRSSKIVFQALRRGAARWTASPAGLSITIASPSMKRTRSSDPMKCHAARGPATLLWTICDASQRNQGIQRY